MKWLVGTMMSLLLISGVSVGQYVPTAQDEAIVQKVGGLLEQMLETDREKIKPIRDLLETKSQELERGSRKHRLAVMLHSVMVDALEKEVTKSLQKIKILEEKQAQQAGSSAIALPIISSEHTNILAHHIPPELAQKQILMLEFTDLQCPFCRRHHDQETLIGLEQDYDQAGLLPLAFPLAFHPQAMPAARMASCVQRIAGFEAYLAYIDEVFSLGLEYEDDIIDALDQLDLAEGDREMVIECYDNQDTQKAVKQQIELGSDLGVTGTPTTILLDQETGYYVKIAGAVPRDYFESKLALMIAKDWEALSESLPLNVPSPSVRPLPQPTPTPAPVNTHVDKDAHAAFLDSAYMTGPVDASVTIIEFSDAQCPFCQRHSQNKTLETVLETYQGEVNLVYGHFPLGFHQNAQKAGEALECAGKLGGNEMFWRYKEETYEAGSDARKSLLLGVAEEVGLDIVEMDECIDSGEFAQTVKDQMRYGQSLGVTGTPGHIVINNKTGEFEKVSGSVPASVFDEVIENYLER